MPEQFGRNHADERQGIEGFHLLLKLSDKALRWASFDDNSVSNIEEPTIPRGIPETETHLRLE
jgi:hypothetical protein